MKIMFVVLGLCLFLLLYAAIRFVLAAIIIYADLQKYKASRK
jgi:hypothetical protein